MKRISALILFTAIIICFTVTTSAQNGLMISPSVIQKQIEANQKYYGYVVVTNHTDVELDLVTVASDWVLDENRKLTLKNETTSDFSLTRAIRFNPKKFSLSPGEKQVVRYILRTPPQLPPGEYRCAFVFSNLEPIKTKYHQQSINLKYNIVSTAYFTTKDISRQVVIDSTSVKQNKEEIIISGVLNSTGEGSFDTTGYYHLYDSENKKILKGNIIERLVVLPGDKREFKIKISKSKLTEGNYRLKMIWEHLPANYLKNDDLSEYGEKGATIKEVVIEVR